MAKTAIINARIEPDLKQEVEVIFDELGLTTTEAVRLFFKRVKNYKGLPFEVRLPNTKRAKRSNRHGREKSDASVRSRI